DDRDRARGKLHLARQQVAAIGHAAVAGDELFEQKGEMLTLLQLALEVDVVGKGPDELENGRCRSAGLRAALLQRALADRVDADDAWADPVGLLLAVVAAVVPPGDDVLAF